MSRPKSDRKCSIEGCENKHRARGWCNMHHQRWIKHGDPLWERRKAPECSIEGCREKNWSNTYCRRHYGKWRHHGDPLWEPITRCQMTNCWRSPHGYGLCTLHYFRWRKHGDPWFDGKNYPECKVEGCYQPKMGRGYCRNHWGRWRKYGDPLGAAEDHTSPMGIDLPLDPVTKILDHAGGLAALLDNCGPEFGWDTPGRDRVEKNLDRAKDRGGRIDLAHADYFAVKVLGSHPALIWGEDYWIAAEEVEVLVA